MKKYSSLIFVCLFIIFIANACINDNQLKDDLNNENDVPEKVLDLYVIIGQSNAAGISQMDKFTDPLKRNVIEKAIAPNIYYYGQAENNIFTSYKTKVAFGQGQNKNRFGPEVGLAKYLSDISSNDSLIFKYAFGGTSLANALSLNSNKRWGGTWTPPSADVPQADWNGYPVTYISTANTTEAGYVATGALYEGMLTLLQDAISSYVGRNKYDSMCLKGVFWMQGEAEANAYGASFVDKYEEYLKLLISDIRHDYAQLSIRDSDVAPFIIGKIAPTYNGGGHGVDYIRSVEDGVANEIDYVFTVETDAYIIGLVNPECIDAHHFGASDMLSLGEDVGEAIYKIRTEIACDGEGSYDITVQNDSYAIKIIPATNHNLHSVHLDGEEVTIEVILNDYSLNVSRDKVHIVNIVFN